jgi:hypothetical protein
MPKKEYAYQNLSLEDMKGEVWEDIPGLDGYFVVSNFGRVKRMEYEQQYRNGAIHVRPEQIIKARIQKNPNRYKKDYTCWLTINVKLQKKIYSFTIARLVYYCFVEHFNTDDHGLLVICKDTNNFNTLPSNLQLVSMAEKQQRVLNRGRYRSKFLDYTEEFKAEMYKKVGERTSKQVTQYTLEGKKIKTFNSMVAAEKATGAHANVITMSASGKGNTAGGFVWRWGEESHVDMKSFRENKRKRHRKKFGLPVTQYDLTGKRVAYYLSQKDAGEAIGIDSGKICRAVKGQYKTIKGFVWKKGHGKPFIDLSNYKWGDTSSAASNSKKVKQYTLTGKYIRTFESLNAAGAFVGVTGDSVSVACSQSHRTCRGYKWLFV